MAKFCLAGNKSNGDVEEITSMLCDSAVLATTNAESDRINNEVLNVFPGGDIYSNSADYYKNEEDIGLYPIECLNQEYPPGIQVMRCD